MAYAIRINFDFGSFLLLNLTTSSPLFFYLFIYILFGLNWKKTFFLKIYLTVSLATKMWNKLYVNCCHEKRKTDETATVIVILTPSVALLLVLILFCFINFVKFSKICELNLLENCYDFNKKLFLIIIF